MVTTTDFEEAVQADVTALQRELEEVDRKEEELRQRRAAISARLAERMTALKVARELLGIKGPTPPSLALFEDVPLGTIAEMCAAYMRQHNGQADVSDLVAFLRKRGKLPATGSSHGHYGTVFGTLRKSPLFRKSPLKGRFRLADWPENGVVR